MRNVVGENCIKYKKTNPAIGPTQLGTLVHVIVQMSLVHIIELELNNLSQTQLLIRLLNLLEAQIFDWKRRIPAVDTLDVTSSRAY